MPVTSSSATVSKVDRSKPGVVFVELTNGEGIEFPGTWDEFKESVYNMLEATNPQFCLLMGLARWIARNPDGANPNQIVGRTVNINFGASTVAGVFTIV